MRFWFKSLLFWVAKVTGLFYFSPSNLSYAWNFGSLAFYFLVAQIVTV